MGWLSVRLGLVVAKCVSHRLSILPPHLPALVSSQIHKLVQTIPPSLMLQSHQTFHPVLAMKLLRIMLRNKCWPTTFYTILAGDADRWCQKQPVWSTPHSHPSNHTTFPKSTLSIAKHLHWYGLSSCPPPLALIYRHSTLSSVFITALSKYRN